MISVVIAGALIGVIVFYAFGFIFSIMMDSSKNEMPTIADLVWGTSLGVSIAFPFCLIAGIPWRASRGGVENRDL